MGSQSQLAATVAAPATLAAVLAVHVAAAAVEVVVLEGMEEEEVEESNLLVQVPVLVKVTAVDCHRLQ